jgi:GT2 family glycosyltransferase
MSVNVAVVIPTMMRAWKTRTLELLEEGTLHPSEVIVINNSSESFDDADRIWPFPVRVLSKGYNIYINPAWMWALKEMHADVNVVCFLSDDVVFKPNFLERVCYSLFYQPDAGCICPRTLETMADFRHYRPEAGLQNMRKREGWAYTMRKELLDKIPPIPEELKLFFGDDFFFFHTKQLGFRWYRDMGTVVLHARGASINTFKFNSKKILAEEYGHYKKYKREYLESCNVIKA